MTLAMTLVGFVERIAAGGKFCFIRVPGAEDYFAHSRDFSDRTAMKLGQYVEFTPIQVRAQGKAPAAANVVAIAKPGPEVAR